MRSNRSLQLLAAQWVDRHSMLMLLPSQVKPSLPSIVIWVAIALTVNLPMEGIVPVALMTQDQALVRMAAALVARALTLG
jgi:hypothetical protein